MWSPGSLNSGRVPSKYTVSRLSCFRINNYRECFGFFYPNNLFEVFETSLWWSIGRTKPSHLYAKSNSLMSILDRMNCSNWRLLFLTSFLHKISIVIFINASARTGVEEGQLKTAYMSLGQTLQKVFDCLSLLMPRLTSRRVLYSLSSQCYSEPRHEARHTILRLPRIYWERLPTFLTNQACRSFCFNPCKITFWSLH